MIAFTAVLGVVTVLALPLLGEALHMSALQYGTLAGLTVYAVPQVLAATVPVGTVAVQVGTLVKLVRVLMLGPVCLVLSLIMHRANAAAAPAVKLKLSRLVPWFIIGFLGMMALRSLGLIPQAILVPMGFAATALTIIAMAALGLGTGTARNAYVSGGPSASLVNARMVATAVRSSALRAGSARGTGSSRAMSPCRDRPSCRAARWRDVQRRCAPRSAPAQAVVQGVVAAHDALQLGELAHHVSHEVGLGQLRGQ
eukprot:gene57041-78158_t